MRGRARQGRPQVGGWGRVAAGRHGPGRSRSTTSTRAAPRASSRSTAGPKTVEPQGRATAYTGPRVTKVVYAVDVGLPINPLGLKAQMMGGSMDGIAQALTLQPAPEGRVLPRGQLGRRATTRASGTRRRRSRSIVMPQTTNEPGGAGEFGVAADDGRRRPAPTPGDRQDADGVPDQPRRPARTSSRSRRRRRFPSRPPTACEGRHHGPKNEEDDAKKKTTAKKKGS